MNRITGSNKKELLPLKKGGGEGFGPTANPPPSPFFKGGDPRNRQAAFWTTLILLGFSIRLIGIPRAFAQAPDVAVVLSSDSPPYREALAGFRETYGGPVQELTLSQGDLRVPPSTKVVVAFGGKAAVQAYPSEAQLIYGLALAVFVGPQQHAGARIRIYNPPPPEVLVSRLKEIQPNLRRLAAFWVTPAGSAAEYMDDLRRAAQGQGIELLLEHLAHAEDLPERLRSLAGRMDAMWLAPDPMFITPSAFAVAKEFGRSNRVPLYAPMSSLVDKGAVASVASSSREIGRTAGRLAAKALADRVGADEVVYLEKYECVLNLTAAAQSGLSIPADVVKKADRVVP